MTKYWSAAVFPRMFCLYFLLLLLTCWNNKTYLYYLFLLCAGRFLISQVFISVKWDRTSVLNLYRTFVVWHHMLVMRQIFGHISGSFISDSSEWDPESSIFELVPSSGYTHMKASAQLFSRLCRKGSIIISA